MKNYSKRFQIVVKINRSSIQAGALADDLITTSYDIQKEIWQLPPCRMHRQRDATPFSRTVMRSSTDGRVIDSRKNIQQLCCETASHAALPIGQSKALDWYTRGKCGSGYYLYLRFLYHVVVLC